MLFSVGSVTWLPVSPELNNLTEIIIKNGANTLIRGDGVVSVDKINDDGSGFLYIGENVTLQLRTHLESCTHVYRGGALAIENNGTSAFAIKRHFDNYGSLSGAERVELFYGENVGNLTMRAGSGPRLLRFRGLTVRENSGLILESVGNETSWKLEADLDKDVIWEARSYFLAQMLSSLRAKRLRFLADTKIVINQGYGSNTSFVADEIFFDGETKLETLVVKSALQLFSIGSVGNVDLATSHLSVKDFQCNGTLQFKGDIRIETGTWSVGPVGKVLFVNASLPIVLQAHTLTINGYFNPGHISTGTGWQLLQIGPSGVFTFVSNSSVIIDILNIAGVLRINGTINLQTRDYAGNSLITVQEGGSFVLDEFVPCSNRTKYTRTSEILALNVTVNGVFHAGRISEGPGWDRVTVGPRGDFAFIPGGHINVDRVFIDGKFRTDTMVVLKGKTGLSEEIETLRVNDGGYLELNCAPEVTSAPISNTSTNSSQSAEDHASQLFAKAVDIDGSFISRKLYIGRGWDSLDIGLKGNFTVHPIGWFSFNRFNLLGKMTSEASLEVQGKDTEYLPQLYIGEKGYLKSLVNYTDIFVDELIVKGKMEIFLLSIGKGMQNLTVTGVIAFNQTKEFKVNTTTIDGSMETWTPFTPTGKFIGQQLNVAGTLKVNFNGKPQQDDGLTASLFILKQMVVSGSAYFGSLHLTADDVIITGLVSVDYGGAMSSKGKGLSLILFCKVASQFLMLLDYHYRMNSKNRDN